ncbi:uncharacterized protein LOC130979473 [Arachis stenosperma]|uniref:uncharacterized protein LOC130979473 n=1 Tax=Arachis stenosperma TaxID=217475 RepID=UPI0025ACB431|nr:uncharacterized protein LOC130979473 [Arachis stenosperma]
MDSKIKKFEDDIKKIDDMVSADSYDGTIEARRKAPVTCCAKWYVKKIHWKQMSQSQHARDMDKNTRYFHNLASVRRRNNRIESLVINGRVIDHEEAAVLEEMPSSEEVREAVWDCESSKVPGSDGYNMNFIKKCWGELGQEFTVAVLDFFQNAKLPTDANVTWVALAPKFVGAKEIKDPRLISMVGCVYKSEVKFCGYSAAEDGLGFQWRNWVKECVTTASMSVLINGSPSKPFKMESGLRQRDPLSPFLFVLVIDVLHRMVGEALMSGLSINFDKSSLIPVNCKKEWVTDMCGLLGCAEAVLPVRYLGISLGANPRLVKT